MGDSGAGRLLRSASCSAPAAWSARPTRPASCLPCAGRPAGIRGRPPSSSAPRPARSPERRCASECPPRTWPRRSTGCPRRSGGGAILRRILPADAEPLPTPSVGSLLRPWNLPSPALVRAGRPAAPGFPAGGGGHDVAPAGSDRHLGAGPGPRRAHRQPLARGAAHLHRAAIGRGPGGLRPRRRPPGAAGRRGAGLVRHPGVFPAGRDRGHRVRRRWRALGDQRRRAACRGARGGGRHLVHVGGPRQRQRGRRVAPAGRAPADGARDRPARRGRGHA